MACVLQSSHSQLLDHMCGAGLIFCVQGDFVMVHWGPVIHNQFQSLYLTKQAKKEEEKKNTPCKETKSALLTQMEMDVTQKKGKWD